MASETFNVEFVLIGGGIVSYRARVDAVRDFIGKHGATAAFAKNREAAVGVAADLDDRGFLRDAFTNALAALIRGPGHVTSFVTWDGPLSLAVATDQVAAIRVIDPDALPDAPAPRAIGFSTLE